MEVRKEVRGRRVRGMRRKGVQGKKGKIEDVKEDRIE
jgi:hypothetical protein